MFKVKWDTKSNGVALSLNISDKQALVPPRPVFYEELDLLGFNKYWKYQRSEAPLLWAIARKYYYKGKVVAEIKGGNMFDDPDIIITENGTSLKLVPINLDILNKNNKEALFTLENEAMDFIEHTYKKNKNKVDQIAAAFSGGKDSQVILDLVSRVIPPHEYLVCFTDTDMEIPSTYETVENTKSRYNNMYPELEFHTAKLHENSVSLWEKFGPPSRLIRWCCSVCKTAPFARLMREIQSEKDQPKLLVYEGVRADESPKRSRYERNADKVKHININNCRPILFWNNTEVYLYLFYREIKLNKGYRFGLTRVGCSICPFASEWSEIILTRLYPEFTKSYIQILEKYASSMGVKSEAGIKDYIKKGNWKTRAGGIGVDTDGSRIDFIEKGHELKAILQSPKGDWCKWNKTLGDIVYKTHNGETLGEMRISGATFPFQLTEKGKTQIITIGNITDKPVIMSKIKNTLYKATYCINCGTCEVECPTGALKVIPEVNIDTNKCVNCFNCLTFTKQGCLMAKSAINRVRGVNMDKRSGVDRYSTFGLRKKWLDSYFELLDEWWESEHMTLGVKQVPAFIHWMIDGGLITTPSRKPTKFLNKVKPLYYEEKDLFWQLLWINLNYNSQVVRWFGAKVKWNVKYTKEELRTHMIEDFPDLSEGTINNALGALINTFDESPLGIDLKLGVLVKKGRAVKTIQKVGLGERIHPIAIAYSLYRYAEEKNRKDFTVTELFEDSAIGSPVQLFGISKETLENILRWLQENKDEIVRSELLSGLDNITIREDLTSLDILDKIWG